MLHRRVRGCRRSAVAGPPRFAEAAAGNGGLLRHPEVMPVQEAGEPVGAGEDLAVDPGVARVLSQFGRCGGGAEELAEAVVFQGADAYVQPGGRWVCGSSGREGWRVGPPLAGL